VLLLIDCRARKSILLWCLNTHRLELLLSKRLLKESRAWLELPDWLYCGGLKVRGLHVGGLKVRGLHVGGLKVGLLVELLLVVVLLMVVASCLIELLLLLELVSLRRHVLLIDEMSLCITIGSHHNSNTSLTLFLTLSGLGWSTASILLLFLVVLNGI